jgi:ketosteroid isomerase-like protein
MPPRHEDTKPHQANGQIGLLPSRLLAPWCLGGEKVFFSSLLGGSGIGFNLCSRFGWFENVQHRLKPMLLPEGRLMTQDGSVPVRKQSPRDVEQAFFTALVEADVAALDEILADDFLLIDVMTGSEVTKSALLDVVRSGHVLFDQIERVDYAVRFYGTTAVITGRTEMQGRFEFQPFQASSRYTHVFVDDGGRWRMVSAQGTQISVSAARA